MLNLKTMNRRLLIFMVLAMLLPRTVFCQTLHWTAIVNPNRLQHVSQ